ncbi:hypothetical protein Pyrde_0724 [Pyrodictium delaneyi]|uniref:Uncharacterized protein n=1 Tax=Pyrodictium delaneyi TaxID=1273541 RepID=A0A0P0N1L8_9CREN|nr:hypothetical protein [Pyrodictium delaneyi]ALL00774.1 hypothetical protein Pyrde_0724 [Pyrodictium delaneyi]
MDSSRLALYAGAALVVAFLAAVVHARPGDAGTALDPWLEDSMYRCMNATAYYHVSNTLADTSPPPWSPRWGPSPPALLTCTCSLRGDLELLGSNCPAAITLNESEGVACSAVWHAGEAASLRGHVLGYGCRCSYIAWQRYTTSICTRTKTETKTITTTTTVTTTIGNTTTTTVVNTTTTTTKKKCAGYETLTKTRTKTTTITLADAATVTIIPRVLNKTYLPVDVYCEWPSPGLPGNCTLRVWNIATGLEEHGEELLEPLMGQLLVYMPRVEVWRGWQLLTAWSADNYTWPPSLDKPALELPFLLAPPTPPSRSIELRVIIEATVDDATSGKAYRERLEYNVSIVYPYGWLLVRDDECRIIHWEPAEEPTVVERVEDHRAPTWSRSGDTLVFEDPGECGSLARIVIERGGGVYRELEPRGRVYRLDAASLPPGNYTVIAVDQAGNSIEVRLHVEPARQGRWLAPALVLLVALAGLGTMTGRKWVRV